MKKRFDCEPTKIAQWQALVIEAKQLAGVRLDESMESYLVFTLDHFTTSKKIASIVLAFDYLESLQSYGQEHANSLRSVGDHCLLLSGLFPERIRQKNVSLTYFVSIGKQAYGRLSFSKKPHQLDPDLFLKLSDNFVGLIDVLHTMRSLDMHHYFASLQKNK